MKPYDIENINALGPFDHGTWEGVTLEGKKIKVGDDGFLHNRSTWLADKIKNYLVDNFSIDDLSSMTVLEVGSYDGWVLTQICKKIKFKKVIGIEPRKQNIIKGQVGRRLEGVTTDVKFMQGGIEDLEDLFMGQKFDIVINLGVLHHVSSTYSAIEKLLKYASDIFIVDSFVVPELKNDFSEIQQFVNTRDIVYQGEKNSWSIAAFKYESPYSDGSRMDFGIVNMPSIGLIQMSLHQCGFSEAYRLGDESDYYDASMKKVKVFKEFLGVGRRKISIEEMQKSWVDKVKDIEEVFCHTNLPDVVIASLVKVFKPLDDALIDINKVIDKVSTDNIDNIMENIISKGLTDDDKVLLLTNVPNINNDHFQILSVIFRMPHEKILHEVGKLFIYKSYSDLAIKYFQLVVRKNGCEWWSFYRSCYHLSKILQHIGRSNDAKHYRDLLILSNENFCFID